jgi:hypothetical protein
LRSIDFKTQFTVRAISAIPSGTPVLVSKFDPAMSCGKVL